LEILDKAWRSFPFSETTLSDAEIGQLDAISKKLLVAPGQNASHMLLIAIIWRIGVYGVDWKSRNSVVALLVAIAVLAFCVAFWKRKSQTR